MAGARALFVAGVAGLLMADWIPRVAIGRWPDRWNMAWIGVWLVVSIYLLVQLIPLPEWLVRFVGAYPESFRQQSTDLVTRISPRPLDTAAYWAIFSAYWATAWIVASLRHRQVVMVVVAVVAIAVFESLYGVVALVNDQHTILGVWQKKAHLADVTGTFTNRNHLAGLLSVSWPLGLALCFLPRRKGGFNIPNGVRYGSAAIFSLVVGLALLNSHSRLGAVSALLGLITWAWAARGSTGRRSGSNIPRWLPSAAVVIAVLGGIWFGLAPLISRYSTVAQDQRFEVWLSTLSLPWQTWILGAGAGTFQDIYRTVQPATIGLYYAYAHNDWLEFLIEFGIVGSLITIVAIGFWFRRVRPSSLSFLQAAALGGIVAIAIHSVADFNLQIPGTALVFWVAVGVLFNRELGSERAASSEQEKKLSVSREQRTGRNRGSR